MHFDIVCDQPSSAPETCETADDAEAQDLFPNLQLGHFGESPQEVTKIKFQLIEAAENIQFEFSSFICNLIQSFEERKLPAKKLARDFVNLPGLSSISKDDHSYKEIMNSHSIDDIMKELCDKRYISLFNYHLLEKVIKKIGTKTEKEAFEHYFASFQKYCERSIFEVPQTMFDKLPKGVKFGLKVNDDIQRNFPSAALNSEAGEDNDEVVAYSSKVLGLSINDTINIVGKLAKTLNLEVGTFCIVNATRGCTKIIVSVSKSIAENILMQVDKNPGMEELKSSGIHVVCGPPGKPQATEITATSIKLKWTKPDFDIESINKYVVFFRPAIGKVKTWEPLEITEIEELTMNITEITNRASIVNFKVYAVGNFGEGVESEESERVQLLFGKNSALTMNNITSLNGRITHDLVSSYTVSTYMACCMTGLASFS